MKKTTIITAKILDHYADLIARGVKHYEVRKDSLDGADAIHLISAESGAAIGTYRVIRTLCFTRDEDEKVMALAQTTPDQFYALFPRQCDGGPDHLWAAELGDRTSLETLVALEARI
ncbi:MAG: hypothetical protein IKG18_15835 [Atopobiaceae bacterium]|nr:hypothetical protein [Atopobiaceae bacterium]